MTLAARIHAHLAAIASEGGVPMDLGELHIVFGASDDELQAALQSLATQGMAIEDENGWRWHRRPEAIRASQGRLFGE